jgi:hypothetical protein
MSIAEQLPDGPSKRTLTEMAAAWFRLAEQAEKNLTTDLVYETPPRQPEKPVVLQQQQQQQQIQPKEKKD